MHKAIRTTLIFILVIGQIHNGSFNASQSIDRGITPSSSGSDQIRLLSFNAWALPVWLPKTNQIKRYKQIPDALIRQEADIICIQEAFARKFRKRLIPQLSKHYFSYSDYYCNRAIAGPVVKDCHGGLATFSKYPIIEEVFYPYPIYDQMRIEERIGGKGFLLSTIAHPSDTIYVINTHLYAGLKESDERHRMVQINYMDSVLLTIPELSNHPVFLLGDLNVRHPFIAAERDKPKSTVYQFVIEDMNFTDDKASLSESDYTIDYTTNTYCGDNNGKQKLDYCLYRLPSEYQITCLQQGTVLKGDQSVSDHIAWHSSYTWHERNDDNIVTKSLLLNQVDAPADVTE